MACVALAGMGIQVAGWLPVKTGADLSRRRLALISIGAIFDDRRRPGGARGHGVWRRSTSQALFEAHGQAAQVGGMGVFLFFFMVNAAVITALRPDRQTVVPSPALISASRFPCANSQ